MELTAARNRGRRLSAPIGATAPEAAVTAASVAGATAAAAAVSGTPTAATGSGRAATAGTITGGMLAGVRAVAWRRLPVAAIGAAAHPHNFGVDGSADAVVHLAVDLRQRIRWAHQPHTASQCCSSGT